MAYINFKEERYKTELLLSKRKKYNLNLYKKLKENNKKVDDIYNTGSNDIYVVKDDLGKQILLPGTKEVLKEISLEKEKIVVHLIKGLI